MKLLYIPFTLFSFLTLFMVTMVLAQNGSSVKSSKNSRPDRKYLHWEVGSHKQKDVSPSKWIPATVPGAVQLDVAKAEKYGPYYYADNWKDYLWMEDVFWTYRTRFNRSNISNGDRLFFISKGIDYRFDILFNGKNLHSQEGMFTPVELDLTDLLQEENELLVTIHPIPKVPNRPVDRSQASQSVKPAVSYGWDWHPRLVPSGIWDDTYLEVRSVSHLKDVDFTYLLNETFSSATVEIGVKGSNLIGNSYSYELEDKHGKIVARKDGRIESNIFKINSLVDSVKLWWPHDHGEQNLYQYRVKIIDNTGKVLDQKIARVGFRRVRLVMNGGAWGEPSVHPMSRSVPPITIEVNGREIFGKGSNWVNPEIFPGLITRETYNRLLDKAKEANFNILRVWGGGIVNKESFFELCDEKGILVWQDFPLACNNYEGTPEYLRVLEEEARSIIKRVKQHPSLAIWCGGNELFNSWSGMTDQSHALRLLNKLCYELDPNTPFLMTAPVMGMSHGHYLFAVPETGKEVFQWMPQARATAYTEFGVPSPSSVEVIKSFIPTKDLWPPKLGTAWETHHAFKSWRPDTWLMPNLIATYFGEAKTLEQLVANGQLMQSEGYKVIFEEGRRQKPYCSMVLNWCYNEPWPTAANNSIINWPLKPKPSFYAVKDACRPFLASARIPKFKWNEDEEFSIDLFMLSDLPEKIAGGKVIVKLKTSNDEMVLLKWDYPSAKPNTNIVGPTVRTKLPHWNTDRFNLLLEVEGRPEFNSTYTLLYTPKAVQKVIKETPKMNQTN